MSVVIANGYSSIDQEQIYGRGIYAFLAVKLFGGIDAILNHFL
jgi:hypothetical protein